MKLIPFGPRNGGIGGTDARIIATGDWLALWEEKTGRRPPPNLDHVFKAKLGLFTEPLHAEWFTRLSGIPVMDPGDEPMTTAAAPAAFMFATFDRLSLAADFTAPATPVELKHTNERATLEDKAQFYMAQLQHQMMVSGAITCWFSIIRGNNEPIYGLVNRDEGYCARLLEQEKLFWRHVLEDEAPPAVGNGDDELAAIAPQIPINGRKPYDMSRDNQWVTWAAEYRELKTAADSFKAVDKQIRTLIPADASTVSGGGLTFKRDARGAFRCTIEEDS